MRTISFIGGILLSGSLAASAQTQPAAASAADVAPVGVQRVRRTAAEINPELEAAQTADRLTGQLSLSPEQTARVHAAALAWSQERRALLMKHNAISDHSTLQQEGAAIEAKYESQLATILTPAQAERRQVIQSRLRRIREQARPANPPAPEPALRP